MSNEDIIVVMSLKDIAYSIELIQSRFKVIQSVDDFLENEIGLEKLDSISMRLIAIGEAFKQIDKLTDKVLLASYPQIEWKQVKGIRDVLSHHYFDLDAEVIYYVCRDYLGDLLAVVWEMIGEYEIPNDDTVEAMKDMDNKNKK